MIHLKRLFAHDFKQLREIELHFPEAGRILVQGKNEAGKSTLFEAVYFGLFGQALATESYGKPNLDDLIGYEKNKARVELDLSVDGRLFRITRTLNRGKPNVWELEVIKGDQIEEMKGNRAVNDRLVAELGFDAEALLNTCFVEQKKLEKLEGLNKAKREESLSKLLNLERLLDLEEKLHLRMEDERLLSRLAKRVELAEAQQELPAAEDDLLKSEGQLRLIELRSKLTNALDDKRAALQLREKLVTMGSSREGLRKAAKTVDALDEARRAMATALDRFDFLCQLRSSLEEKQREVDEIDHAAKEQVPALEHRVRDLNRLARGYERLGQIEQVRASRSKEVDRLGALQKDLSANERRLAELATQSDTHIYRAAEIETLLRSCEIGDALGAWSGGAREVSAGDDGSKILEETKRAHENAAARQIAWLRISGVFIFGLIAATALIPAALYLRLGPPTGLAAAGLLLVLDAVFVSMLIRRAILLSNDVQSDAAEIAKAEGESIARRALTSDRRERLTAAEARLRELGVPVPASPEAAEARRVEIAATLDGKTAAELRAERDAVREQMNYSLAQRDEVLKRSDELQALFNADSLAQNESKVKKATEILARWGPYYADQAERLQVAPNLQAAREARQDAESQRKTIQSRARQTEKISGQIRDGESRANKISEELRISYEAAAALNDGNAVPLAYSLSRDAFLDLGRRLTQAFEAQGGEGVRAQLNSLEKEIGGCEGELKHRDKAGNDALAQAVSMLNELGSPDTINLESSIEELSEIAARLQNVNLAEKTQLEARVKSLHMRVGGLRETRDRLQRELGLQGEEIEVTAAHASLENEQREQEERKYGVEIVLRARKRIVQKILPATMDYMRRILPQLTRDRYHDAELDPETYKIKVWDERAGQNGAWKEKNIFSGGTKDQFSVALRLAFALATLPQERGTSPGFIFLDEPLSSFDDERSAALLYLLTEGEIARAFDQIFLISHVHVQEDRFTHHLVMENGAVKESSLT